MIAQKSRIAADGRNDGRPVDGHISLPDVTLHRLVLLYGRAMASTIISDVAAAYPHALADPRFIIGITMPKNLPQAIID